MRKATLSKDDSFEACQGLEKQEGRPVSGREIFKAMGKRQTLSVSGSEPRRFYRRQFSCSYAILSTVLMFAYKASSALVGVMYPMGSSRR